MKKLTTWKRIGSLFLTLAMVLTMTVTALPVFAAGSGSISVVYNPTVVDAGETLDSTTFHLYKVGHFEHAGTPKKAIIKLEDAFAGKGIDTSIFSGQEMQDVVNGIDPEDEEWQSKWLEAAKCLEHFVKYPASGDAPASLLDKELQVQEDPQSLGTYDNGIYLLVGDEKKVGNSYWWPVPVLIMVLNGESVFTISDVNIKMDSTPVVYKHTVTKSWNGDTPATRPEKIRVGIFYGTGADAKLDTVELNKDNNWTYTWYSMEQDVKEGNNIVHKMTYTNKNPDGSAAKGIDTEILNPKNNYTFEQTTEQKAWGVAELRETVADKVALKYYTTVPGDTITTDTTETFLLINTFTKAKLVIEKDLQSYLDQSAANAMVVFEVTAKFDGLDEPIYHNKVTMAFTKPGKQTIELDNLPINFDTLTVEEIYSTNYTIVDPSTYVVTFEPGDGTTVDNVTTYTASFTNKYNGPPVYSKGIVNIYDGSEGKAFKIIGRPTDTSSPQVQ